MIGSTQTAVVEETTLDEVLHREDGPAVLLSDGTEEWYFEGRLHRTDGPAKIDSSGKLSWYTHGVLHRDEDLPAVIKPDGSKRWYLNGSCYSIEDGYRQDVTQRRWGHAKGRSSSTFICDRKDGPAIVRSDGTQIWMQDDKPHRVGGPAKIDGAGNERWYVKGKLHRLDGPAVVMSNGSQEWWVEGLLHRDDDLPAVIAADGRQEWFVKGLRHRDDGPAVVPVKGNRKWWKNGRNGDQFCGINGVDPVTSKRDVDTHTPIKKRTKSYSPARPKTHVYLIDHNEYGIQKIGITGNPAVRLGQHEASGFSATKPRDLVGPLPHAQVRQIETLVLKYTRSIRKASGIVEAYPTLDGKTECWSMDLLKVGSVSELLEKIGRSDLLSELMDTDKQAA